MTPIQPIEYVAVDEDGRPRPDGCSHLGEISEVIPSADAACEDCLREGTSWVHLRLCLVCGHMGCCDNSPRRHATGHWHASGHPVMRSAEPGEEWAWCYPDDAFLLPAGF